MATKRPHYLSLIASILLVLAGLGVAAPANDSFANATALPSDATLIVDTNTVGATTEAGDPVGAVYTVWYAWTANHAGPVVLSANHTTSNDAYAAVLDGSTPGSGTYLASGQIYYFGVDSISFNAVAGKTYHFCVYSKSSPQAFKFYVLTNDNFANAQILTTGVSVVGTLNEAGREAGDPSDNSNHLVWYQWTAPASCVAHVNATSHMSYNSLHAFIGNSQLTGKYITDDGGFDSTFYAVAGQVYRICYVAYPGSDMDFSIGVANTASLALDTQLVPPLSNDGFDNAFQITGTQAHVVMHTLDATFEGFEQTMLNNVGAHFGTNGDGGVWATWTAPAAGKVTLTAQNVSSKNIVVIAGTGNSLANLTPVAAAYNGTTFNCQPGVVYHLYYLNQSSDGVYATLAFTPTTGGGGGGTSGGVFGSQSGIFNGTLGTEGYLTLTLGKTGSFTGKYMLSGVTQGIKGKFGADGKFVGVFGKGQTVVNIHLDLNALAGSPGDYLLSGTVGGTALNANHAAYAKGHALANIGRYTALLDATNPGSSIPPGTGYATLVVGKTGGVAIGGKLADGKAFTAASILIGGTAGNQCIWHAALAYPALSVKGSKGFLVGSVTFENLAGSDFDGAVQWVKPLQTKGPYPTAINTSLSVAGATYVAGRGLSDLPGFSSGTLTLNDSGALKSSGGSPITKAVTLTSANKLVVTNPGVDKLAVKVVSATGQILGTFRYPGQTKPLPFGGVLFQKNTTGKGFFVGPSGSGTLTLQP